MQEQIIQLLRKQDCAAITLLYDNYGGALYNVVLRVVPCKEVAQQVIQDTFLKVWSSGANYDASKGTLFTWLLRIARNTAIDATRTSHYRTSGKTDNINALIDTSSEEIFNPEVIGLKEAVQKMDEKYKVMIDLIYFGGYTQKEVAEEIGIPIGTVKTRMRYAISELRKDFKEL